MAFVKIRYPCPAVSSCRHRWGGRWWVLWVFAWTWTHALGLEPQLSALITNGPTARRINLVLVAEGYTEAEQGKFAEDAAIVGEGLLSAEPFLSYARFFNVFGLFVASEESGSSHPLSGIKRKTYFNSTYDSYNITRLLTLPPNNYNPNYSEGEGRLMSLLRGYVPEYDLVAVVVNDPQYGGSGGSILVVSTHPSSGQIAVHELGHALAHLGDEYSDAFAGYPDVEEPNTTRETVRERLKWRAWVNNDTPLPTPPEGPFESAVGLFEGAHYHASGWYRPKLNCKMRALAYPFCDVCVEALDLALHRILGVFDRQDPDPGQTVLLSAGETSRFLVQSVSTPETRLSTTWRLSGQPLPTSNPLELQLSGALLTQATQTLSVTVTLESPWVRTDPGHLLTGSVSWTVVQREAVSPQLTAVRVGQTILLRWPARFTGFQVERCETPETAEWHAVAAAPELREDQFEVQIPALADHAYYRLRQP